jgi:hypothetical protein
MAGATATAGGGTAAGATSNGGLEGLLSVLDFNGYYSKA